MIIILTLFLLSVFVTTFGMMLPLNEQICLSTLSLIIMILPVSDYYCKLSKQNKDKHKEDYNKKEK